ncbi:radical SAM protein [candidate division WOR-3 bacterium]|nr:radical SAM protein [candidate division WOR-3 bacterium]
MELPGFPVYLQLSEKEFKNRIEKLYRILNACTLCGHKCEVNRHYNRGICNSGMNLKISSVFPHFGEERPLVGTHGSGTIFLSNCNCKCVFCQNFGISHLGEGDMISEEEIASKMIYLQDIGCHNINWVSPTHFAPQLVKALFIAREKGLRTPVVYNTGGYDSPGLIKILAGIIDIYMPDIKYGNNKNAFKYSGVKNYWDIVRVSVKEMYSQVGDLIVDDFGIAKRGLIIRHLVLPNDIAGSSEVLKFIADEISKDSYVNIMKQYTPYFKASNYKELMLGITMQEYLRVLNRAKELGLTRAN